MEQGYINHIALVLDGSGSMRGRESDVIKVTDGLVKHLAQRSQEMDQETRVTVYIFEDANRINCVFYDKDALRLPSIAKAYRTVGQTPLIDATLKAIDDLTLTPELYGDHAFLIYVITDGVENASFAKPWTLKQRLEGLKDNWTVGVLVPDKAAEFEAKKHGFAPDNIEKWSTAGTTFTEVGQKVTQSVDTYMTARASGVRGTKQLFSMGADVVNKDAVKAMGLAPLAPHSFFLVPVPPAHGGAQIKDFTEACGYRYVIGRCYYQLSKRELIQANKFLALVERKTQKVYLGDQVRQMIGLPSLDTRVSPDFNPDFDIFVQSTSVNRKLVTGTKLLILP